MKIRIIAAGAAMFAGLILNVGLGTPAWAVCLPLWGTICRPDASPSAETAAPEAKPRKPLNLRTVAHKGGKRTHLAARHRQPTAAKQASRNIVTVRSRLAAARRLASARRRANIEARHRARQQAPQVPAVATSANTTRGTANPPQTDGYVPSQNEVTALDLAADKPRVTPPAAEAPSPALWNAVTPTDPAANAGVDPPADGAKVAPANDHVASADNANPAEVASPAPQQPADEPSWLRRIVIGLGGVLTLASAVRLFAG